MLQRRIGTLLFGLVIAALLAVAPGPQGGVLAQTNDRAVAQDQPVGGSVPGETLGTNSDSEIWRAIRRGAQGNVSIPNRQAGVMIQSYGESWRNLRNGPLSTYGAWWLLGMIALLALFFLIRGRVKIESGESGRTIQRFSGLERGVHWMTAVSFIVLALSGLNLLYGRYVLLPVIGADAFTLLTIGGKWAHNFLAFPFMLGIVLMFILWVAHNIPNRYDFIWLAKGGGLFSKHSHPPSKKFNAGQKILFWLVVLTGLSLSLSGVALLFPFQIIYWGPSFEIINAFGATLPTDLTVLQEQQLSQVWHAVVALFIIAVIVAHIYIGSIGMQGAFAAMGSGQVDVNWAREHHSIWTEEKLGRPAEGGGEAPQPAE